MTMPNVLPIFVVAVMKDLALSAERAGMLLTAEMLTLALTPVLLGATGTTVAAARGFAGRCRPGIVGKRKRNVCAQHN